MAYYYNTIMIIFKIVQLIQLLLIFNYCSFNPNFFGHCWTMNEIFCVPSDTSTDRWLSVQTNRNVYQWRVKYVGFGRSLTVDVHQDADVGASHGVEHLTGHGLGEEGVVRRGHEHTFPGTLQQHSTFSPSDGGDHAFTQTIANECDADFFCWRSSVLVCLFAKYLQKFWTDSNQMLSNGC